VASSLPGDPRVADLVQSGQIRAALFLPQYTKDTATGELRGLGTGLVAIEIARALAARLGVAMAVIEHPTPPKAVASLQTGACDIAFLGIEPSRAAVLDFSPPIIQFDYTLLVPAGSSIASFADADRPGVRIAIVGNHASTLALRRIVKAATLVENELPDQAFALLRGGGADTFALPREVLEDYAVKLPESRVLEDRYGVNLVGIAVQKGRAGLLAYLNEYVGEAKTSGLLQRVFDRGGLRGFQVPAQAN
jgi:polar amino acid transport system substrate-binding protein